MSFLVIEGLTRCYGGVAAVEGIGLSVAPGSRTAVVGPSGSGKTTLLRLVAGFETADAGRITLGGDVVVDGPNAVPAHRRGVGIVAQDGALFPHLSVGDNIGFGLDSRAPDRAATVASLMQMVGLDPAVAARRPDQVSGGQQQRVALARAMARKPRLMLLDEAFSALDAALRASTRRAVVDVLEQAGITSLLVTHDREEALSFADQVAVMRDGRFVQVGAPAELYARPVDEATATLLGDAIILPATVRRGQAVCALGRIEVAGPDGPATIMLRPEQLALQAGQLDETACRVKVLAVDYAGASCTYTVQPLARGYETPLLVRQSGLVMLPAGAIVSVVVEGRAHILPGLDVL